MTTLCMCTDVHVLREEEEKQEADHKVGPHQQVTFISSVFTHKHTNTHTHTHIIHFSSQLIYAIKSPFIWMWLLTFILPCPLSHTTTLSLHQSLLNTNGADNSTLSSTICKSFILHIGIATISSHFFFKCEHLYDFPKCCIIV